MNDRALKVLEQYELEIISTRRGRGSYICETTQGLKILCDYTGSENKALFQNRIMPVSYTHLFRMKEIWIYMFRLFPDCEKYAKQIKKSQSLAQYLCAVDAIFTQKIKE